MPRIAFLLPLSLLLSVPVQAEDRATVVDRRACAIEPKVIAWRRDICAHPELSNRETRAGELIAALAVDFLTRKS
jgi:hypothetical protein